MTKSLYIVGIGGFGREVHDVSMAINAVTPTWDFVGFIDEAPALTNLGLVSQRGSKLLGNVDYALDLKPARFVVGIGSPLARKRISARFEAAGWIAATLIHPQATLGHDVEIGAGSVICAGAHLTTHIRLGRHVHVDQGVTIGHDTTVGAFSRLNPQACISGDVHLGPAVVVGANATVLQGLSIGQESIVGAGAVVIHDVASHTVVKGIPAK